MTLLTRPLTVTINGRRHGPIDVPEGLMMIDVLHEMLDLTGSVWDAASASVMPAS